MPEYKGGDMQPKSRYGIICGEHGVQGLSEKEYDDQMNHPDRTWRCPIMFCESQDVKWDDDRYEGGPSGTPPNVLTVKELIVKLLDFPDLDVPVIIRGNELHSYDFDIGLVDSESTDAGWQVILYLGRLSQERILAEQAADQDTEPF